MAHGTVAYAGALALCDLCRGDALAPGAVLLLPVREPGGVRPRRAALMAPSGQALYGDSFVLCSSCARSLPEAGGRLAGWQPLSLLEVLADLGRAAAPLAQRARAAEAEVERLWRRFLEMEERLDRSPAPEGAR
jgi:hypothetical protein